MTARRERFQIEQDWNKQQAERTQIDEDKPTESMVWLELAVQVVHHDYLECKFVSNGATYGSNINVAKDPGLRRSSYHHRTISGLYYDYTGVQARTVTKSTATPPDPPEVGDASKDQVIIPKYFVPGDEPAAPTGGLAFTGSIITAAPIATTVEDDGGSPLQCQYREITQRAYANDEEAN